MCAHAPTRPLLAAALLEKVEGLLADGRPDLALKLLESVHATDAPSQWRHTYLRTLALCRQGSYPEAEVCARGATSTASSVGDRVAAGDLLARILVRLGRESEAEFELLDCLGAARATPEDSLVEAYLLNSLAALHRQRGQLGAAIEALETAHGVARRLGAHDLCVAALKNQALAFIHRADFEDAERIVESLLAGAAEIRGADIRSNLHLTHALLELHRNRLSPCAAALARAGELSSGQELRTRVILREYSADLAVARGEAASVVTDLKELLIEVQEKAPFGDLVPEVARRLAAALMACGHASDALEAAGIAMRCGSRSDRLEWAAGLRIAGECQVALGQPDLARESFANAYSVLAATEFLAERKRLDASVNALGLGPTVLARGTGQPTTAPQPPRSERLQVLMLRDGRALRTHDRALVERIQVVARGQRPALIIGETGTGKELVAHLLHELGPVADKSFQVLDCTNLPEPLAETELFGVAKGAFTGADRSREGLVAAADGGTLFLDELSDLPVMVQAKLLRLMEAGTYRRIGETEEMHASVRIIAATNRDPDQQVEAGKLRRDFLARLDGHRIALPPLKSRPRDLDDLVQTFARQAGFSSVSSGALRQLQEHSWPGNVRELRQLIAAAADWSVVGAMLDDAVLAAVGKRLWHREDSSPHRRRLDRSTLEAAMRACGGNKSAAARRLGIARETLRIALRREGLI